MKELIQNKIEKYERLVYDTIYSIENDGADYYKFALKKSYEEIISDLKQLLNSIEQ